MSFNNNTYADSGGFLTTALVPGFTIQGIPSLTPPPFISGVNGKGIDVSDLTNWVDYFWANDSSLDTTQKGAIDFWFMKTGPGAASWPTIVDWRNARPSIRMNTSGNLSAYWVNSSIDSDNAAVTTNTVPTAPVTLNQWHHVSFSWFMPVAGSKYPSGHYEFYYDGKLSDQGTFDLPVVSSYQTGAGSAREIKLGTGASKFQGYIDEFHAFNEPLFEY